MSLLSKRKTEKVLLIQPPAFCNNVRGDMNPNLPLGIAYIAAMLEKNGYSVKMLDAFIEGWFQETRVNENVLLVGLRFKDIKEIIADYAPDVVGITSMFTMQRRNAHRVAAIAKEVNPSTFVILGGAHPTAAPEMVLEDENVDAVVLGEGDNSIVPLLRAVEAGDDFRSLDGVGYRRAGQVVIQDKHEQILDLDALPFPARHLLPMEKYFAAGVRHGGYSLRDRATSLITSRGCQYRCNFCTAFKVFTRLPRMRSADNIMAEIDELVTKYKVNEIFFEDDQFIAKTRHTFEVLDTIIARSYDLVWDTPNGISPWLLSDELIEKMRQAGCIRVNLAIESGNQFVLKNIINKPVKLDQIPGIVKKVREQGMVVNTFLVVGNVSDQYVETKEQIKDSFRFCRSLGVSPFVSYLTPYPGSEVLQVAQEKGYLIADFSWDNLMISKQNLTTPEWTPSEIKSLVERERVKTEIYVRIRAPLPWLADLWQSFKNAPVQFPGKVYSRLKYLATISESANGRTS